MRQLIAEFVFTCARTGSRVRSNFGSCGRIESIFGVDRLRRVRADSIRWSHVSKLTPLTHAELDKSGLMCLANSAKHLRCSRADPLVSRATPKTRANKNPTRETSRSIHEAEWRRKTERQKRTGKRRRRRKKAECEMRMRTLTSEHCSVFSVISSI